jgi:hypothetical protein
MKLPKIGIIYGGIFWQKHPWEGLLTDFYLIDLYKISKKSIQNRRIPFYKYDIVIVPWAPDQIFLKDNEYQIHRFLRSGGILVAFGEFDLNWLPDIRWRFKLFNDIKIVDNSKKIFDNISNDEISNWDDSAHGYFTGTPPKSRVIVIANENNKQYTIGYTDTESSSGSVLALTMDPDFHSYNGIDGATKLLKNIIEWAFVEYFVKVEKGIITEWNLKQRVLISSIPNVVQILIAAAVVLLTSGLFYLLLRLLL